jgi:hypothetical protein
MVFMPLIVMTAFLKKAALAQGGFFAFTASVFSTQPSASHTPCHCLLPLPNVLTGFPPRRLTRLPALRNGRNTPLPPLN